MSDAEIEEKFLALTKDALNPKQAQPILGLIWLLEDIEDANRITHAIEV